MATMRIATKLPTFMVGLAALSAIATGAVSFVDAETALETAAMHQLDAVRGSRDHELSNYLDSIEAEIRILSGNEQVVNALGGFERGWNAFESPTKQLRSLYIEDNPHPAGEKDKLTDPGDGSAYSQAHAKNHPWFHELLDRRGYYDVFLVDEEGDVVYSVFKEADFGTNLLTGRWKDSGLAEVVNEVLNDFQPDNIQVRDFAPYGPSNGAPAAFIGAPVFDEFGKKHGVLVFQMPIDKINNIMNQTTGMGRTGQTFLVGPDRLMRSDSRFSEESDILKQKVDSNIVAEALSGEKDTTIEVNYRGDEVVTSYGRVDFHDIHWALISQMNMEEVDEPAMLMARDIAIAALVVIALVTVVGIFLARGVSKPLATMTAAMKRLADKDWTTEVPAQGRGDEIGEMAGAVQVFKDNGIEVERLEKEQAEKDRRAEEEKRRLMNKMADEFQASVGGVVESVSSASTEMESTAQSMSSISEETSSQAATVAAAAEQASANVQTVSSAAEELSSSISEISRQVSQSSEIANRATQRVDDANTQVKGLADAADKISEVVSLITDIAEQTNLLALNATIEAARAGDAGKGFAVVANEVKSLAQQTQRATEEISSQISSVQAESKTAVEAIRSIGDVIHEVNEITSSIASAVEEQNAATGEIARNVEEASAGTQQVTENIAGVTQAATEASSASSQVLSAAGELNQNADTLKREVDKFIKQVRES